MDLKLAAPHSPPPAIGIPVSCVWRASLRIAPKSDQKALNKDPTQSVLPTRANTLGSNVIISDRRDSRAELQRRKTEQYESAIAEKKRHHRHTEAPKPFKYGKDAPKPPQSSTSRPLHQRLPRELATDPSILELTPDALRTDLETLVQLEGVKLDQLQAIVRESEDARLILDRLVKGFHS
jgi:hypothetical protein